MQLFRRLPIARPRPGAVVGAPLGELYPTLAPRVADLERTVATEFASQEALALQGQLRHRRLQTIMLFLTVLTSTFGAVQAALGDVAWPGAVVGVVALAAAGVSRYSARTAPLANYLRSRARAEELRALYFRYLGGLDGDDERRLEARVAQVSNPMPASETS
jgi:hypothetical protein